MGESKFEKNLREKFEERRIEPSLQAWKKLESGLKKSNPKNKKYWVFYVAAGFVGILILTTFFLNRNVGVENQIVIIENPQPKKSSETVSEIEGKEPIIETIREDEMVTTTIPESEKNIPKKEIQQKPTEKKLSEEDEKFINEWALQVANSIKSLPDSSDEELINEVESLLESARKEMFAQKIIQETSVDAVALLDEVEWELDKNFREKIFDFLGDKYEKIRTTLSLNHD